jgi:phosphatidate cytidylyltransferase
MNETLKRAISGAVYITLLLTCILYSIESFFILFGIFLIIATYEFCDILKINKFIGIPLAILIYGAVTLVSFYKPLVEKGLSSISKKEMHLNVDTDLIYKSLLLVTILVSIKCIHFLFTDSIQTLGTGMKYLYLIGYVILPFLFITKISFGQENYNNKIIIGLFILIWTNDTFAYLVGKSFGKHKLFERISPKKTVEGFLGGVTFAIIAGFLLSKFFIQPNPNFLQKSIIIWTTIAVIVGCMGTIGDLVESKFKRIAGVKDSGAIMPGHGGMLDRLDSIIFVAPFIFLFYQILYYVS